MKQFQPKLKLIYLPFLKLGTILIAVYTFLYWLLFEKLKIGFFKEDVVQLWIPMAICGLSVFIWVRPRLQLLTLKTSRSRDASSLYLLIAAAAIAIPMVIAVFYIDEENGNLISLSSVNDIRNYPSEKYFAIKSFMVHREYQAEEVHPSYSGRYNEDLNFDLYIVCPITQNASDTLGSSTQAFYGTKYHKQVPSSMSANEKEQAYHDFYNESVADFEKWDLKSFSYLRRTGNNNDRDWYSAAARKCSLYKKGGTIIILEPGQGTFDARTGSKFQWIFLSFLIGAGVWLIMILFSTLNDEAVKQVPDFSTTSNLARFKNAASAFFPKKGFFATPLIVDINILVYFTMVLSGLGVVQFATKDLLRWGANSTYFVGRGEWWRLLTCVFIHGGLMHIVMNMVSLYIAGTILEKKIGPQKFFAGYIITGIIASTVSIWWHDYIVSVGASGAILGLDGIILALLITKVFSQTWQKSLLILLAFTAGYTIVLGAFTGGVDNAAHVGGFIAGIIFGFIITPWLKKNKEEREEALVMEETGA